jgi:hypothetical protein
LLLPKWIDLSELREERNHRAQLRAHSQLARLIHAVQK